MKKASIFVATVALSCCGLASAFAQIQPPSSSPGLTLGSSSDPFEPAAEDASGFDGLAREVENPFDFFASEESTSFAPPTSQSKAKAASDAASPAVAPYSVPVGRRPRPQSMVDTILDHATVAAVPNAAMAPIYWSAPAQAPNHVADYMLREDCNPAALWDGYAAQRAAECAKQWARIAGHHRHHGCAAPNAACDDCVQPVRNRYTQPHGHTHYAPAACDSSTPVRSGLALPPAQDSEAVSEPETVPAEATTQNATPSETEQGRVALLPPLPPLPPLTR